MFVFSEKPKTAFHECQGDKIGKPDDILVHIYIHNGVSLNINDQQSGNAPAWMTLDSIILWPVQEDCILFSVPNI